MLAATIKIVHDGLQILIHGLLERVLRRVKGRAPTSDAVLGRLIVFGGRVVVLDAL